VNDLEASRIEAELGRLGSSLGRPLAVLGETGSTNDDARKAAATGAPHGAIFVADAQTKGRGRGGHTWHSPSGENLYLSVVLRPRIEPSRLPPLPLVLGLCVAAVVDRALAGGAGEASLRAGIKWPNDVIVDGHKIAGLLVESTLRGAEVCAIAGIGLNVHTPAFPAELSGRATSLALLGAPLRDRSLLCARLVATIGEALASFEAGGFARFHEELVRRDVLVGVPLEVGEVRGEGAGIDAQGHLRVRDVTGAMHSIMAGSVITHGPFGRPRPR
jgi:BirA family biotin operon repressor/biotin-[acetyl-CoA-carboxylase] ligase